jgi:hypothetical protein
MLPAWGVSLIDLTRRSGVFHGMEKLTPGGRRYSMTNSGRPSFVGILECKLNKRRKLRGRPRSPQFEIPSLFVARAALWLRRSELAREYAGDQVLQWEDVDWQKRLITVRHEVAKQTSRKIGNRCFIPSRVAGAEPVSMVSAKAVTAKIIDLRLAKPATDAPAEAAISTPGAFAGTPEFASLASYSAKARRVAYVPTAMRLTQIYFR